MRLPYYILFFLFPVAISCVSTHLDESDNRYIPVTDSDADTDTDTDTDIDLNSGTDTGSAPNMFIGTDSGTDSATNSNSGVADTDSDTETGTDTVVDTETETGTDTDVDTATETGTDTDVGTDGDTESSMDTRVDTETDTRTGADTESSVDTSVDTGVDTSVDTSADTSVDTSVDTGARADCTVLSETVDIKVAGNGCVIVEQLLSWATVLRLDSLDNWTPPISFDWENGCDGNIVAGGSETFSRIWQTFCFRDVDPNCPTTFQFTGEAAQSVQVRFFSLEDNCVPSK
jgi:hypothetical protein